MSSVWDVLKTVGAGAISTMVPGGPLVLAAINAALPDDMNLPTNATGEQAIGAISALPPAQRDAVMQKQLDVDIAQIRESNQTMRTMLETEAKSTQSTRPRIALGCFQLLAAVTLIVVSTWAWAVIAGKPEMVEAVMDGWPFLVGVTGTFATVLLRYFGALVQEQKNKLSAITGADKGGGVIASVLSAFK